jgi:hypothetical protein
MAQETTIGVTVTEKYAAIFYFESESDYRTAVSLLDREMDVDHLGIGTTYSMKMEAESYNPIHWSIGNFRRWLQVKTAKLDNPLLLYLMYELDSYSYDTDGKIHDGKLVVGQRTYDLPVWTIEFGKRANQAAGLRELNQQRVTGKYLTPSDCLSILDEMEKEAFYWTGMGNE